MDASDHFSTGASVEAGGGSITARGAAQRTAVRVGSQAGRAGAAITLEPETADGVNNKAAGVNNKATGV